jgi:cytochrome c oxidase subunit 2
MDEIMFFHDYSMILVVLISLVVFYMVLSLFFGGGFNRFILDSHLVELIWTVLPALVLIFLAVPSMKVLYMVEEVVRPFSSFKVVGHQWYWSYEINTGEDLDFDSFIDSSSILRLIKVSGVLNLPLLVDVRGVITSADVIHSWSLPSVGVKVDAVPGRLNQIFLCSRKNSLMVGQCSEICGANHSFMPIVVGFFGYF